VYAVVRTGGKQYRVEEGRPVRVERLAGEPGDTIELGDVLLMANGDDVTVGAPTIDGARVLGTIADQGRAKKIVVFRYKAKTRSRKKTGHRQRFTTVLVSDILAKGQEPKPKPEPAAAAATEPVVEEKPRRGRRRAKGEAAAGEVAEAEARVAEAGTDVTPAEADQQTRQAPADEAPAEEKPRRSRRKKED
jgi:large subunit ribosomal protein L21